jgi:hypothetical protein
MAWTNDQKKTAAIAARKAGLEDEHRQLILRQIPGNRAIHQGRVTSTSPRLGNADFEWFMAAVEASAGGELDGWARGYWARKANDSLARMRRYAGAIAQQLQIRGHIQLDGFIERMTSGACRQLEQLDMTHLYNVIEGLKSIARRHQLKLD